MRGILTISIISFLSFSSYSQRAPKKRSTYRPDTCQYVKFGLLDYSGVSLTEKRIDSIANVIEIDSGLYIKQVIDTETVVIDPGYYEKIKLFKFLRLVSIDYYFDNSGELKKIIYTPYKRNDSCLCPQSVFYYHTSKPIKAKVLDYVIVSPYDKFGTYRFNSVIYYRDDGEINSVDKEDKITAKWLDIIFDRFIDFRRL